MFTDCSRPGKSEILPRADANAGNAQPSRKRQRPPVETTGGRCVQPVD